MHILIISALLLIAVIVLFPSRKNPEVLDKNKSKFEREIESAQFNEMVIKASHRTPVVVDFYATWCEPCQYLTPLLSDMTDQYQGQFLLAKVDTDRNKDLTHEYGIEAMPTVMIFKDGKIVDHFEGAKPEHTIRYTLAKHGIMPPSEAA